MPLLCVTKVNQTVPIPAHVVRLPSYTIRSDDDANMRAIVEVSEEDFPATSLVTGDTGYPLIGEEYVLCQQTAAERLAWVQVLSARYGWPLSRFNVSVTEWLAGA